MYYLWSFAILVPNPLSIGKKYVLFYYLLVVVIYYYRSRTIAQSFVFRFFLVVDESCSLALVVVVVGLERLTDFA
jgi:hypothetical protein